MKYVGRTGDWAAYQRGSKTVFVNVRTLDSTDPLDVSLVLQKWLESDGRNQFGSGGISGKDLGKRMQTYQRILREYQDMTPEEFWSRIRSQITYAGQGRTTDLAAFLRNIYERPSDGWYGELS